MRADDRGKKRKVSKKGMPELEARYHALFESLDAAVLLMHGDKCVECNPATLKLFGLSRKDEILGKTPLDFAPPLQPDGSDSEELVRRNIEMALEKGLHVFEWQAFRKNGEPFYMEVRFTPYRVGDDQYFQCIAIDITGRKRAEMALRESETRTRSIIESIPMGMHMYRLEADGRLVFTGANPAADRMLGMDNSIFIGKAIEEAFPALKGTEVPQRYREVIATGSVWRTESIEYRDNLIEGAFEVHAFRTGPDTMVAAFVEITERKRSEMALKDSEAKFRRLYNETPVLMHSIDLNAVLVDVNDYWLETMGYARGEVIGRKVTEFYTPASKKYAEEVVQPLFFRDGFVKDIEYQFVKKSGEVIDVELSATAERDEAGSVVRSQAVIVDMTGRKRVEEALRKSEARYRMLYEGTPVMMHSINAEGKLISVSDHWLRTLGYTREEVMGRSSTDFLDEQSAVFARAVVLPAFMQEGICTDVPYTFVTKGGERISTLLSAIAERDETGRVVRSLAVIIDITKRKQAEDALRESEERFRRLVEQSPIAITIIDKSGRIEYINRKHKEIVGYAVEEVPTLEEWWSSVYPVAEIRQQAVAAWEDIAPRVMNDEDVGPVERTIRCRDGASKDVEMRFSRIGEKILAVFADITGRKRAEAEARLNEARMASLYRISQYHIRDEQAFLDCALHEAIELTGSTIGYLYFYDEAKREFNLNSYSRDVMKECSIAEKKICYELERTGIWGEAVRQRRPILLNDFEAEHPLKKGYPEGHARLRRFLTVPVIMEGAVVAVVGVANKPADYAEADIMQLHLLMDSVWKMVQRTRAEGALKESEARFRDLVESLPLTVYEMDDKGRFTFVNRAALETFGYTQQDIDAGLNVMQVVAQQDHERVRNHIAQLLSDRRLITHEYVGVRKDGSVFPISAASSAIYREGHPAGIRGIVVDLTERKELEEERLKAQKLESIGTLAGGIAHDFNNLLQGVFGYISMAKNAADRQDEVIAMLAQAEEALHLTVNLTTQLLTFSKGGKPVKKPLMIRSVVENAVKFALSGSHTDYTVESDGNLWPVEADAGQLAQVVQNIALNANEAMAGRGTVRISLHNARIPKGANPGLPGGGQFVRMDIRDTGIGIPEQDLARIFDPYFTTKQRGSGLGLATSYSIVKNHGGVIEARSRVNQGSTFTIFLPALEGTVIPAGTSVKEQRLTRKGRVLVMDDEAMLRKVARDMISVLGHEVETAADGREALELFTRSREEGRPFDLVILDLTVKGGMGGEETVRRMREIDPGAVAVVSSGYADSPVVANFREYGFSANLNKPYLMSQMRECLAALLGGASQ